MTTMVALMSLGSHLNLGKTMMIDMRMDRMLEAQ